MVFEKCLSGCVCVRVCVSWGVYAWISASYTRSNLTRQVSFFFFFWSNLGAKIRFFDWADAFLFHFEFSIFS